jgi:AcrR family transcriptional regulator
VDDIGAAVGIAGPSIYNHFTSKAEILAAAMFRGNEWLWMEFNRACADAPDAAEALRRVVLSYQTFAFHNPDIVEVLTTEVSHLPEAENQRARSAQRAYIDEWVHLVRQLNPNWTSPRRRSGCSSSDNDQRRRGDPAITYAAGSRGCLPISRTLLGVPPIATKSFLT